MKILVTGGASDIAKEIVKHRLSLGDECTVTASSQESLDDVLGDYRKIDLQCQGMVYEFSTSKLEDTCFDAIILNAATKVKRVKPLHELADDEIGAQVSKDIIGNMKLLKDVLPYMMGNNFGRIVFISSLSSQMGTSGYSTYIAAKSALEGVMRNIAVDYGKYNITANNLRLGLFKTKRNKVLWKRDFYQDMIKKIVLQKKMGVPSDVLKAIDFLLDENLYATGTSIDLGGGIHLPNSSEFML